MAMMLQHFDAFNNIVGGREMVMQLVSTEIDPRTMEPKLSNKAVLEWLKYYKVGAERSTYKVEFEIDSNFGFPGAITVTNKYDKEIFLEGFSIEGVMDIACNSWVQPEKIHPEKRIFFSNKAYLPCHTPMGLKELRKEELRQLRGNGKGERKGSERVYDYDVYNDLGIPDKGNEYVRPILGTKEYPCPRRCRTGRPSSTTDKNTESPANAFMETYVPRDEVFEGVRKEAFDVERVKGVTRNLIPFIRTCVTKCGDFEQLSDIQKIYKRKHVHEINPKEGTTTKPSFPMDGSRIQDAIQEYFKFDTPLIISGNGCCIRDEELGRQALAGINPLSIKRLEIFPPVSNLDPSIHGGQESALKEEHIISHLDGMSVQQALAEKKLFILDYHDAYLPFLNRINAYEDRKAYATRTILYLTRIGTLKPIAIELSLSQGKPSKQVLTPPLDANSYWLWQIGKAHVCSNEAGFHQLVHHWLRTHSCMEPFIIAAHRQLSVMHPVFKLLKPHLKHTLQINALAREALINAGGIIESDFSPGKYSTEIVSAAYRDWWRFDMESLPADLIRRGLAEPDPTQPHGLRLLIEDYPYANDGLLIWFALENLVRTYVNYYYRDGLMVRSDSELQAWYNEAINVGHTDHANASWWPTLSTPGDLTSILTTLIWIVSVQHSAVNFGQYPLGGYVPMRPPLMKKLLPKEEDPEYKEFVEDPEGYLLSCLPNLFQTTKFLAVVNILSQHSTDEEYIGQRKDLSDWAGDPDIREAFYKFSIDLKRIEKEIEKRNRDPKRRNRCGAGVPPYELLIASSAPGATCRGVPNSISI
ncbi:lipoxygenase 4, chloroplastic-like [Gastrolobium bilobum]|uniref:lipoxygenase 4, chloroplastic-like n=1 Tax=Gastrolobium bilobum TaxID=150636 RepID=UPI002AAF39C2|nr:lipoxygenase 4, chloroplastic-like [Gastrolobium bilobum]